MGTSMAGQLASGMAPSDRIGSPRNTAGCCDGHGQVHHNASGDDSVVNALSYVTLCMDRGCEARRDATFMGVSAADLERYF